MGQMTIKKGSDRPWQSELTSGGDSDLSLATAVKLYVREVGASVNMIDGEVASIDSATATTLDVSYNPRAADVDAAGEFKAYWKVTIGGKTGRFPSKGFDEITIEESFET